MSNPDRLQGGMKHAPGVLCIIAIPSKQWFRPAYKDNKVVVRLANRLLSGNSYVCDCGNTYQVHHGWTVWKVERLPDARKLHCNCGGSSNSNDIPQQYLIPLGNSSLIEGEKWEEINPKEDKIELASVLVAQFRQAYPQLIEKWKEHQS